MLPRAAGEVGLDSMCGRHAAGAKYRDLLIPDSRRCVAAGDVLPYETADGKLSYPDEVGILPLTAVRSSLDGTFTIFVEVGGASPGAYLSLPKKSEPRFRCRSSVTRAISPSRA